MQQQLSIPVLPVDSPSHYKAVKKEVSQSQEKE